MLRRTLALSTLAACLTGGMAAAVLADAWVRGGHWWRAGLLAVLAAMIAWVIYRKVLPRWKRLSFDEAALLLERTYPQLGGRLVTAVQLADASHRARSGASDALYDRVLIAAENAAGELVPSAAVPGGPTTNRCLAAWALILAVLVTAGLNTASASIGIRRVLLPWQEVDWPKRTHIRLSETVARVVRGGTLILSGQVDGVIPANGILRVRAGRGSAERAYFEINRTGEFNVQYRPVMQDLEAWVEIGDNATSPIRVSMVPPPEIVAIQAECTYPAFTHLPPQQIEDGNVQAVFGTELRLRITANKPITDARLAWEDGKSVQMTVDQRPGAETVLSVTASQSYRINLTDANGFHNPDPVIYRIEMTDNQYPQIDRVAPAIDRRVTPVAVLPILAEISDDYGVSKVTLVFRKGNANEAGRLDIPLTRPGKRATALYPWSLEPLGLQPGDSVTWWLEARDEGEHAGKHDWPVSRPRKLKVMSEVELARALNDEWQQIMDKLTQLEALQSDSAEAVKRIAGSIDSQRPGVLEERTQGEKWRQDRLARTAAQLAESLGRVADDYAASRIGQEERWMRLRATADRLAQLGGSDMPAIVLALEDALNSIRGGAKTATRPVEGGP